MTAVNVLPFSAAILLASARSVSSSRIVVLMHQSIPTKHQYVNLRRRPAGSKDPRGSIPTTPALRISFRSFDTSSVVPLRPILLFENECQRTSRFGAVREITGQE